MTHNDLKTTLVFLSNLDFDFGLLQVQIFSFSQNQLPLWRKSQESSIFQILEFN